MFYLEARPGMLNISVLNIKHTDHTKHKLINVPTMTRLLLAIGSNFQVLDIFGF